MKQSLGKIAITPKGEYNVNTEYEKLDLISYSEDGGSFIYINNEKTTGQAPIVNGTLNDEYWQRVAAKGEQGTDGIDGQPGSDAITITDTKQYGSIISLPPPAAPDALSWTELKNLDISGAQGKYLWTKTDIYTNNNNNTAAFSIKNVTYCGLDADVKTFYEYSVQSHTVTVKAPFSTNVNSDTNPCYYNESNNINLIKIYFNIPKGSTYLGLCEILLQGAGCSYIIGDVNLNPSNTEPLQQPYVQLYCTDQVYNWASFNDVAKAVENQEDIPKIVIRYLTKPIGVTSEESESEPEPTP